MRFIFIFFKTVNIVLVPINILFERISDLINVSRRSLLDFLYIFPNSRVSYNSYNCHRPLFCESSYKGRSGKKLEKTYSALSYL